MACLFFRPKKDWIRRRKVADEVALFQDMPVAMGSAPVADLKDTVVGWEKTANVSIKVKKDRERDDILYRTVK